MKKVLILPDIHYPHHDKPSIEAIENFMPDFKPTHVVYLGDQIDLGQIMDYWQGKIASVPEWSITKQYAGFDIMMRAHQKLCPRAQFVFLEGNHEERIRRLLQQQPLYEKSNIDLENYFQFKKRHIIFVPFNKYYKLGHLYMVHGYYTNQYHARKINDAYRRSVAYGHTHTFQTWTDVSPYDISDNHISYSLGCLCNLNAEFMHNRPHHWIHGFGVAYIQDNGNFNLYFVKITSGHFTFGKSY